MQNYGSMTGYREKNIVNPPRYIRRQNVALLIKIFGSEIFLCNEPLLLILIYFFKASTIANNNN